MSSGKFYWLKLKRDFFKRHDIQIIEDMPNGKEYILFYLKLLCESVDHDGNLRFSEQIPYNENMLATITRTNVDIVKAAIQVFTGLNMMELMDDGTFFMSEVHKMIGSAANNDNANRQRRFREKQKQLALSECYDTVTKNNESKSKSKSKSIELDNNPPLPPQGDDGFDAFWKAYPKKVGKADAIKKFSKAIQKVSLETLLSAVEEQKTCAQWQKDGGQYIPNPSTWLNQERWNDDIKPTGTKTFLDLYYEEGGE